MDDEYRLYKLGREDYYDGWKAAYAWELGLDTYFYYDRILYNAYLDGYYGCEWV